MRKRQRATRCGIPAASSCDVMTSHATNEKKERSERKVWEVEIGRAGGRSVDEARLAQVSTMTADGEHETSRSSLNMAASVA